MMILTITIAIIIMMLITDSIIIRLSESGDAATVLNVFASLHFDDVLASVCCNLQARRTAWSPVPG